MYNQYNHNYSVPLAKNLSPPSLTVPMATVIRAGSVREDPRESISLPASRLLSRAPDDGAIRDYLRAHDWPTGHSVFAFAMPHRLMNWRRPPGDGINALIVLLYYCESLIPVDDSGSMAISDGNRFIRTGGAVRAINSSRWLELTDAMKFHAGLADAAQTTAEFRLLNRGVPLVVGDRGRHPNGYTSIISSLEKSPDGGTPLCFHIRAIIAEITALRPQLMASNQKAVLVIATDGESSDGDVAEAMRPLKNLPVQVVLRLCTNEEKIINYWNNIDNELELSMDVLDDLVGEAAEVYAKNPWLNYSEPMHRLREFGVQLKEMDLIDEQQLSADQIYSLCRILYRESSSFPHPGVDWSGFLSALAIADAREPRQWNPRARTLKPMIDMYKLRCIYGWSGCCIM